uniref:VPS8 subunit of CORVET complex n=1 Tax=Hippocampus comes TaxID=109280 RepID=A0A3Q3DVG4_HIPCM
RTSRPPCLDTPPTLESILNELEDEEEPFVLEDTWVMNTENIDARSCDSASLASSDSGDPAHFKRKKKAVELKAAVHGSVLRHSMLQGISAQIVSAADKVDAGLPTAITVAGVIVVGTSHGLALVFDNNQALRLCLGTKTTGAEFGAISALSINNDCSRLLCGFAKGQITMWDLANGKLLRTITDAHPPGTAILHSPIYQKGQFAEIQVLILGMLDTFNYEQTLFETTTSLLNHDLHWSLAHLRTAVTRGLHPRQDYCNICLQQYKRWQDPSEQILLFSCGHLYHVQCLQQQNTDCGLGGASEQQQQQWSCYKCSTVHRGRGRQYTIPTRSRSTSLAQYISKCTREHGHISVFEEVMLDFPQEQSWNHLRCLYKGPSRLSVLTELSHCHSNERAGILIQAHPAQESFSLKLSPPPLLEE